MTDVDPHDETNYPTMSPAFEAAIIASVLANDGFDAEHQGDGSILFSDEMARGQKVRFRMRVELE